MKLTLEMGSTAFKGTACGVETLEPVRILQQMMDEIKSGSTLGIGDKFSLIDSNGDRVGEAKIMR